MSSTTYGTMNDPKGGVAKDRCPTFEAMGQIPMFHRTYFLLLMSTVVAISRVCDSVSLHDKTPKWLKLKSLNLAHG